MNKSHDEFKRLKNNKELLSKRILDLFNDEKLLIRGLEPPNYRPYDKTKKRAFDFSYWAAEYDTAEKKGITSKSCTLLIPNHRVNAFKSIGFILDSNTVELEHLSIDDSNSSGSAKDGSFYAFDHPDGPFHTIEELAVGIKKDLDSGGSPKVNEVNATLHGASYIGIFSVKDEGYSLAMALLSQRHFYLQTNKYLPLFIYNPEKGKLNEFKYSKEQFYEIIDSVFSKNNIINENGFVDMFYFLDTDEEYRTYHFDGVNKSVNIEKINSKEEIIR